MKKNRTNKIYSIYVSYRQTRRIKKERDVMIAILYFVLGYWATGKTLYANKMVIYTGFSFFFQRLAMGMLLGWILIPVAIIKTLFGK